jgi:hypothetical protein
MAFVTWEVLGPVWMGREFCYCDTLYFSSHPRLLCYLIYRPISLHGWHCQHHPQVTIATTPGYLGSYISLLWQPH